MSEAGAQQPDRDERPGAPADAVDGCVPDVVVRPEDRAALQHVVREHAARRQAMVVCGRGRHLELGAPPRRLHALVRLDRLHRLLAYEPADMTVTVEAGCTLAGLQASLAQHGQWLPLDPPAPDDTTIGGLVAANLSGPLRASCGGVRDFLIGIAVVGADGALVRGGGRVVKNVAGYDLPKLHVGALGTLGAIAEATFKVRPRPAAESAVVAHAPDLAGALALARALRDAIEPSWLEVASPASLVLPDAPGCLVAAGMAGPAAWVRESCAAAVRTAAGHGPVVRADGAALRETLSALAVRRSAAILRVAVLPADLELAVAPVLERLAADGLACDATAHAASGVARVGVAAPDHVPTVLRRLRETVPPGATVVVERAPAEVKAGLDVWGPVPGGAALMARVKEAFDRDGVFAPGRFVLGL